MSEPNEAPTAEPAGAAPIEPDTTSDESREAQDNLTASVGQRLTREGHDGETPRWKRWLGKS